jgi:sortase A
MSYENTGQFKAVVEQLNDPLSDPLPGRPPVVQDHPDQHASEQGFAEQNFAEQAFTGRPYAEAPASPWFRAAATTPQAPPQAVPQETREPVGQDLGHDPVRPGTGPQEPVPPEPVVVAPEGAAGGLDAEVVETAQMPVVAVPDAPADDGQEEAGAESAPSLAPPQTPPDGGRAARRRAARQGGGGHRAGARGQNGPGTAQDGARGQNGPGTAQEAASVPLSRVEARKAAKAAKDSPAVVASRIVGELFITAGVLMLLFVTYQLWWTNVRAHQQANGAANNLQHQWDSASADPNRVPGTFSPGQGFAIMYIPKLDVKAPIAQGIAKHDVLDKGMIGHYDGSLNTAMPWDKTGNFAVAAHRNTHGEPFRYINHLAPGDKVVVETASEYYTYQITSSLASTPPTNTSVLRPIPVGSGYTAPGRYLTLTTCTPEFTSTNRLIVWGKLIEERPRSKGKPDALVGG